MTGTTGAVWKQTGWYIVPRSSREVMTVLGTIGVYSSGQRFAWRGMSSADHNLTSSLHRLLGRESDEVATRSAELKLLTDARAWGLGVAQTSHIDDLDLLADLQHYGIATRLIDFTSNPMTALWFACLTPSEPAVSRSGVLLALNVTRWPTYASVGAPNKGVTWGTLENPSGSTLELALASGGPFLVESSHPNDRLRAQEGFFAAGAVPAIDPSRSSSATPFASLDVPFTLAVPDELEKKLLAEPRRGAPRVLPFVAVIIKSGLKLKLLAYLENTYNRKAKVLFPDYAGFRRYGKMPESNALETLPVQAPDFN